MENASVVLPMGMLSGSVLCMAYPFSPVVSPCFFGILQLFSPSIHSRESEHDAFQLSSAHILFPVGHLNTTDAMLDSPR